MMSYNAIELAELMHTGKYSDMTLVCAEQEFKVHKMVVCSQSPVFAAAIDGPFQESVNGVINIEGFNVDTVRQMVKFLYTGDYSSQDLNEVEFMVSGDLKSDTSENADASNTTLADHSLHHVRMNAIADYYNIAKLAELTRSRIQQLPLDKWDPHVCLEVTRNALDLTGDRAFHKTMALVVAQNIRELLTMEQLGEIINDFGIDVLRHRTQRFEVDEGRLRLQLLQLQEELRMEQVRRESSEARADRIIENIKQCMQSLVDRAICRNNNCRAQFDCYIEQRGQTFEPLFTLRCAACRCRH